MESWPARFLSADDAGDVGVYNLLLSVAFSSSTLLLLYSIKK